MEKFQQHPAQFGHEHPNTQAHILTHTHTLAGWLAGLSPVNWRGCNKIEHFNKQPLQSACDIVPSVRDVIKSQR